MENIKTQLVLDVKNKVNELEIAVKKAVDAGLEVYISSTNLAQNKQHRNIIEYKIEEVISY